MQKNTALREKEVAFLLYIYIYLVYKSEREVLGSKTIPKYKILEKGMEPGAA